MSNISMSESLTVEFKSDRKTISESVIVEEIVALANTDGGELYIGVEDNGEITGVQPAHRDVIRIAALIAGRTVPPLSVRAVLLDYEMPVLRLEVAQSKSVVATSSGKVLRRRLKPNGEPETVPMFPYEITSRLTDLGRLDFSAQPIPDATREDFDVLERERLRAIIEKYSGGDKTLLELPDEELERALSLTANVSGESVPTLTGMLLLGKTDSLKRFVPTHGASFQVLQGTDVKVNIASNAPLLSIIERLFDNIEPWNPVTEIAIGVYSAPVPLFDKRAIREAIVNAFGHRDYSVLGEVRILIDDSGLTITNPGGFIEGISVDNLLTADPRGRNQCLMDALKRVGLAERTGRGIDRIFEGSLQYGRPAPDYSDSNTTRVSLYLARSKPDQVFISLLASEAKKTGLSLSLESLLVLDAVRNARRLTLGEMQSQIDMRQARLRQTVEMLVEAGLLETSGTGRNRVYMLSSHVYRKAGKAKEYVRQAEIDKLRYSELIMKLVESQGRVTTADVSDLLHVEKQKAYYEISKLIRQGVLKKEKNGPDAFYIMG
ncbi:ATP-binding protein [uncultured Senegalimassilia sp.]|uniref:ATP-binding protein n=1 Tax=uncultured Senegalimassilia sp. TaxID=1714350 RepID=UPI0025D01B61|nr:ATP-binding protein [uncultured Senegalimassilia sp.]